ncbi:MAG TPA: response regulator [Polyangia bacterium]|nr:response regulator [Polyangia bacterium]
MSSYILVVEDDKDLRETLSDALELEGYAAIAVEHGEAALRHLRSGVPHPCLILLDLMMPVMDGWTFRKALLADPALAAIPVVVMTAAGRHGLPSPPAERILHKPLRMDRLFQIVHAHCPVAAT